VLARFSLCGSSSRALACSSTSSTLYWLGRIVSNVIVSHDAIVVIVKLDKPMTVGSRGLATIAVRISRPPLPASNRGKSAGIDRMRGFSFGGEGSCQRVARMGEMA
jgi:hypothetical protein